MCKKSLIGLALFVVAVFSFSACFANNDNNDGGMLKDAADGVRNVVGDAENAIEGAAKDVSNASKDATGDMENKTDNDKNGMTAGTTDNNSDRTSTNVTNNGYVATRTATTDTGATTFMGMSSTAWTWLILGIAGIAIVALVWYYGMQVNSNTKYDDRD